MHLAGACENPERVEKQLSWGKLMPGSRKT